MVSQKIDLTEEEIFKEKRLRDFYLEGERCYKVSDDLIFIYDTTDEKIPYWMNEKVKLIKSDFDLIDLKNNFYWDLKEKYELFMLKRTERDHCYRCGKMTTILKKYDICDKCTAIIENESAMQRILNIN